MRLFLGTAALALATPLAAQGSPVTPPPTLTFEQVFASPSSSQVVLRLHATLWPAGATGPTLQQHWRLERPAATPDAAGAVRSLAQAVDELLPQLADWLAASACR